MRPTVLILLALTTLNVTARDVTLKLPSCEYTLTLPVEPDVKVGRTAFGTALGPSMVAVLNQRVPAYRIECQGFSSLPPNAREAMIGDTDAQIAALGLEDMQKTLKRTRLGVVIEFSGTQRTAGRPFVVSGRNFLGRRSFMSVVATESAKTYPSAETTRVLNSVAR